jgi:hypothetical protein
MDPLDKLEIIFKHEIKEKKKKFERGIGKSSDLYLGGLRNEIDALSWALTIVWNVKRNSPTATDEMIERLYGPLEKEEKGEG